MAHEMRKVTIWQNDGRCVWAYCSEDGDLHIDGQDLKPGPLGDEYEYFLTIPADQIALVEAALPNTDSSLLDRLAKHGEHIVHRGEKTWLESIGVKSRFFSISR